MSYVRLVLREANQDWSGTLHGSTADRVIAALSADPVTLSELQTAVGRYEKPVAAGSCQWNLKRGFCDEPYDAGIVVIDLIGRVVCVDSCYSAPGPTGNVKYHDGIAATDVSLYYHLAEDWKFIYDIESWHFAADKRRDEKIKAGPLDVRKVLYGRPMIEFIARQQFSARAVGLDVAALIKKIHVEWLMTPREDLRGMTPREAAIQQHEHVSHDLQQQQNRWARLEECPPGVADSSHAFLYGSFGTHEWVEYYELVRELLWSCQEQLRGMNHASDAFMVGDFLTTEVPRLECVREKWLDTPDPEFHGRTPRSIIDRERRRLPEAVSGDEAIVDPDCPCCRAMAELPGPVFWHLDGCNMDDDFAFSIYHRTYEEWEQEQREWEQWSRESSDELPDSELGF
ncbi:hypothetical protein [Lacunimicrobium album]